MDGETQDVITYSMLEHLQSIICYDYEDCKPWHDLTCVMELIFNDTIFDVDKTFDGETDCYTKLRFLYMHPWHLFGDFSNLVDEFNKCERLITVRMDITAGCISITTSLKYQNVEKLLLQLKYLIVLYLSQ